MTESGRHVHPEHAFVPPPSLSILDRLIMGVLGLTFVICGGGFVFSFGMRAPDRATPAVVSVLVYILFSGVALFGTHLLARASGIVLGMLGSPLGRRLRRKHVRALSLICFALCILNAFLLRSWFLGNLVIVWAILPLLAPIHEAGHVLAGLLSGHRILQVRLGQTPLFRVVRIAGCTVEIGRWPGGGFTNVYARTGTALHFKQMIVVLGGPATNAVLLYAARPSSLQSGALQMLAGPALLPDLCLASGIMLARCLVPTFGAWSGSPWPTDGWHLLATPFIPRRVLDLRRGGSWAHLAEERWKDGDDEAAMQIAAQGLARCPGNPFLLEAQGLVELEMGKIDSARANFECALASIEGIDAFRKARAALKNNIAYADFLLHRPELLKEADRLSAEAAEQFPRSPAVMGTRGAILAWMGRPEQAIPLLRGALHDEVPAVSRAIVARLLQQIYIDLRDEKAAARYQDLAATLDPGGAHRLPWHAPEQSST